MTDRTTGLFFLYWRDIFYSKLVCSKQLASREPDSARAGTVMSHRRHMKRKTAYNGRQIVWLVGKGTLDSTTFTIQAQGSGGVPAFYSPWL